MNLRVTYLGRMARLKFALIAGCSLVHASNEDQILIALMQRLARLEATVEGLVRMVEDDNPHITKQGRRAISVTKKLVRKAKDKLELGKADDVIGLTRIAIQDLYNTLDENSKNSEAYIAIADEISYCHYLLGKALYCKGDPKSIKLAAEALETAESLCTKINKGNLLQYVRYALGKVYKSMCDLTNDENGVQKYEYLSKACITWEKIPYNQTTDDPKLRRMHKKVKMYLTQFSGTQPQHEQSKGVEEKQSNKGEDDSGGVQKTAESNQDVALQKKKSALIRFRRTGA